MLQGTKAKVEQKTDAKAGGFQIIHNLGGVGQSEANVGFELDKHFAEAHEVGPVRSGEGAAFVGQPKRDFPSERHALDFELDGQSLLVDGLEEAATKLTMNRHGATNDAVSARVALHELPWVSGSLPLLLLE
ncbi:MAG: hypothetical protein QOI63_424 [Thermoplasmata archaeon]|nr:hypothetical protein [Thermoplasmata archaeon]